MEKFATAEESNEMVTKINRGDVHPFPIPENVMQRVQALVGEIRGITNEESGGCTFGVGSGRTPTFLRAWERSLYELRDLIEAFDTALWDLAQAQKGTGSTAYTSLVAVKMAFEMTHHRYWALWEWAGATWRYDPAILAASKEQKDPSPDHENHEIASLGAPAELQ